MKKRRKAYDEIRKQYPETISKDQFYRIAHISKATDELKIIVYKNYDLFLRLIEIKNCKFIENNKE